MPESVEAEEIHFFHSLFRGPLFESHAVGSDENACAIIAEAAMDENLLPRFAAKQRQELNDLFVGRRRPAADGNMHKAHSKGLSAVAFPGDFFLILTAKIDNRGDPQELQFREARFLGLCATVEKVSDSAGVVHTGDLQLLSEARLRDRSRGRGRSVLRENTKRKNQKECKRWKSALHIQ